MAKVSKNLGKYRFDNKFVLDYQNNYTYRTLKFIVRRTKLFAALFIVFK